MIVLEIFCVKVGSNVCATLSPQRMSKFFFWSYIVFDLKVHSLKSETIFGNWKPFKKCWKMFFISP